MKFQVKTNEGLKFYRYTPPRMFQSYFLHATIYIRLGVFFNS